MRHEYVALADQLNAKVTLVRMEASDWNKPETVVWEWAPTSENGFYDCEKWENVSDIKLRRSEKYGGTVMLTCASLGFGAIVRYPSGEPVWSIHHSDLINPHAVELLPNGNFCIASSQGNSVRVYAASQGIDCGYAEAFLEDAHGLLWDPERSLLWALAGSVLTAYRIGGTDAAPTLTEQTAMRTVLPTRHGHDLQPVYGDHNRLWVTTSSGIYQFDKTAMAWRDYPEEKIINCNTAKSIGNQPHSGSIVRCVPNGTQYDWNTNTVDVFHRDNGSYTHQTRFCQSGAFYKARVWCEDYQ